jgi:GntR family transcriptional regulator
VANFEPVVRDANRRLSAGLRAAGQSVWSADAGDRQLDVLEVSVSYVEDEDVPDGFAETLGAGRLIVRDRVYAVDGRRLCWARSYLPAVLAEGNPMGSLDTGPGGTPARLAELGHELVSFVEDVEFVEREDVTDEEQAALGIDSATAVARVVRRSADANGLVVEVTDMRLVASAYVFRWAWKNA